MNKIIKKIKGFTLTELIVVIAIIGILAAVLIPSIVTYVDKAKMSNDTSYAKSLSDILSYYEAEGNDISKLQASDVRNILIEQSEKELNFDAQLDGVGYFYDSDNKKIVALKYGDASKYISAAAITSPEELFGEGLFLVSTKGDAIAEAVYGIRNLGLQKTEANMEQEFTKLKTAVNNAGLNKAVKDKVTPLFTEYDPTKTIYVTNNEWILKGYTPTTELQVKAVNNILFTSNTTNIPSMTLNLNISKCSNVIVPYSIKTIEKNSLSSIFDTVSLTICNTNVNVEKGAFSKDQLIITNLIEKGLPSMELDIEYSTDGTNWTDFNQEGITEIKVGSNALDASGVSQVRVNFTETIRSETTEFQVARKLENNQWYYIIKVFSKDGLIGTKKLLVSIVEI